MIERVAPAPLTERRRVAVDLIGDLDADLGAALAEALDGLRHGGDVEIHLNLKGVAHLEPAGVARAAKAIAALRLSGSSLAMRGPRNRHVKAFLSAARIETGPPAAETSYSRHIMIARHSRAK